MADALILFIVLGIVGIVATLTARHRYHAVHQQVHGGPVDAQRWLWERDPDRGVEAARRVQIVAGAVLVVALAGLVWALLNR